MQQKDKADFFNKRFVIFLFCGGLNTIVTYLLYLLLSCMVHYQVAYLIAYITGIVLAYGLNLRFVFNAQSTLRKIISYPIIYGIQYLLGAGLMFLLLSVLRLPNVLAPLIVIVLLMPVSYCLNKKILVS